MAKPIAGEWLREYLAYIGSLGVRRVVSLLELAEQYELGLEGEAAECAAVGLQFRSYPIPDRGIRASLVDFLDLTKSLYHSIAGAESTVVHCRAGIGRSGMVAAGVLVHAAFDPLEAFSRVSAARGVEVPDTDEQYAFVVQMEAALARAM